MNDNKGRFKLYRESPLFQLFASIVIIMGVGFALTLILILSGILIFGGDLSLLGKPVTTMVGNDVVFLRYLLIIQDISLFIIPSLIILTLLKSESDGWFPELKLPRWKDVGLVLILAFCIFPVTSFTGQLNSGMHLPQWLSGIERWMTQKEEEAGNLIDMVLVSRTFGIMIMNLFIIAILPAIGEELIFRGVFQKIFFNLFRSGHIAIWITAFIFSSIHFQFFGFVPRFILGLVFGYLFFWSGNLWLPVISHFANNAFPVVLAYIQGLDKMSAPSDVSLWKQAIVLPLPVTIGLIILFIFRDKYNYNHEQQANQELIT